MNNRSGNISIEKSDKTSAFGKGSEQHKKVFASHLVGNQNRRSALEICKQAYNKWRELGKNFDEYCIHMNSDIFFELAEEDNVEYNIAGPKNMSGAARIFDMVIIVDESVPGVEIRRL